MIRKKNGFLTFIFSLIPGAGEMYMGFYKQGISIMTIFFLLISLSSWLNLGALMFIMPILWFYSFFHVHNMASLRDEEFYALEDKFFFDFDAENLKQILGKENGRRIFAIILIVVGVSALWNIVFSRFASFIYDYLGNTAGEFIYYMIHNLPQCVFSVAIILLGIHLIKGKKKELDLLEDKKEKAEEES